MKGFNKIKTGYLHQLSICKSLTLLNSFTLFVIKIPLLDLTVEAIKRSFGPIIFPFFSKSALSLAYSPQALSLNAIISKGDKNWFILLMF